MKDHHGHTPNALARFMDGKPVHTVIAILVIINAGVLGLMTYYRPDDTMYVQLEIIDHIILAVFAVEIMLRLLGHGFHYFRSGWNVFDFVIIMGSLIAYPGQMALLRSLRVFRLFYLVEISRKMRHILSGLAIAFNGICHVILLMVIIFYAYAILGVNLFYHPDVAQFQNLTAAFHTLFQVLTGDDWYNVMRGVLPKFAHAWVYFYSFYIVMSFIILNFFIGIIVGAMQNAEDEMEAQDKKSDDDHAEVMHSLAGLRTEVANLRKELMAKKETVKAPSAKASPSKKEKPAE